MTYCEAVITALFKIDDAGCSCYFTTWREARICAMHLLAGKAKLQRAGDNHAH